MKIKLKLYSLNLTGHSPSVQCPRDCWILYQMANITDSFPHWVLLQSDVPNRKQHYTATHQPSVPFAKYSERSLISVKPFMVLNQPNISSKKKNRQSTNTGWKDLPNDRIKSYVIFYTQIPFQLYLLFLFTGGVFLSHHLFHINIR